MVASSFSSETRLYILFNKSSFEFKPLLLKQSLTFLKNLRLSDRSLTFRFLEYSVLVLRRRSTQKFLCFL